MDRRLRCVGLLSLWVFVLCSPTARAQDTLRASRWMDVGNSRVMNDSLPQALQAYKNAVALLRPSAKKLLQTGQRGAELLMAAQIGQMRALQKQFKSKALLEVGKRLMNDMEYLPRPDTINLFQVLYFNAWAYGELGDTARAQGNLGQAYTLVKNSRLHPSLVSYFLGEVFILRARIAYRNGERTRAIYFFEQGIRRLLENPHFPAPEGREARLKTLTEVSNSLAELYFQQGRVEEAIALLYDQALMHKQTSGERSPVYLESLLKVATFCAAAGLNEDAIRNFTTALEWQRQLAPNNKLLAAQINFKLGKTLTEQRQYLKAQDYLRTAQRLVAEELGNQSPAAAEIYHALGQLARDTEEWSMAENHFLAAIDIYRKLPKKEREPVEHAVCLSALAMVKAFTNQTEEALQLLEQADKLAKTAPQPDPLLNAQLQHNYGIIFRRMRDADRAAKAFRTALDLRRGLTGDNTMDIAYGLRNLGDVSLMQNNPEEALRYYRQYGALVSRLQGEKHPMRGAALTDVGIALEKADQLDSAGTYYRLALAHFRHHSPAGSAERAQAFFNLVYLLYRQARYDSAYVLLDSSLYLRIKRLGEASVLTADSYTMVGRTLWKQGLNENALGYCKRGLEIYKQLLKPSNPLLRDSYDVVIILLESLKRNDEARLLQQEMDALPSHIQN